MILSEFQREEQNYRGTLFEGMAGVTRIHKTSDLVLTMNYKQNK